MFHKIRLQLTAMNALVLFIMLVVSGFSLYGYMQHRLYEEIDNSLQSAAVEFMRAGPGGPPDRPIRRLVDQQAIALFWSNQGQVVAQAPEQAVYEEDLEVFRAVRDNFREPQTVTLSQHNYRTLALPLDKPVLFIAPGAVSGYKVDTIQLVRNIDSEQEILNRLLMVLIIGCCVGVGVTVWAGFFLAGRALVPIKISWEKQQQFVADASHELRTPLAVIRSHGELMLRHPTQTVQDQSQNISIVLRESKRMSKLVADLLTLARSDSDQLEINRKPLELDLILQDLAEQFTALAEIEGIELHTDIATGLRLDADEERMRQLFVILIDNALKYTEQGRVTLTCKRAHNGIEVKVQDTGIGIAEQDIPHVFDRFFRADKARNRASGGTGLGLSIAKWIVEVHGGKIWLTSALGTGTTVHMLFPARH